MPNRIILTAAAVTSAALLAGCAQTDPLTREGVWRPTHVNRADITLMAANPADLVRGTGETTSSGVMAAAAIDRLYTNKLKKLPDSGLSQIQVTNSGGGGE
jgi:type IV pilus biogenesis protein CpaD/CtpE